MKQRKIIPLLGGVSGILCGLWGLTFQLEVELDWLVFFPLFLALWLGGALGLQTLGGAGRPGKASLLLSMAGGAATMGIIALGIPSDLSWMVFITSVWVLLGGLTLFGIVAIRRRPLKIGNGLPLMIGFSMGGLLLLDWQVPAWVNQGFSFLMGLGWSGLGYAMIFTSLAGPGFEEHETGQTTPRAARRALATGGLLLLLAVIAVQAGVMRANAEHSTCPAPPALAVAMPPEGPRRVIADLDMAHEDMHALLYLLQHPGVKVEAVTVAGTGEAHCGPGVAHAQGLLALHGKPEIPVACGSEQPLQGDHEFPASWREEVDNLYGLKLPENPISPSPLTAPELIAQTVAGSPDPVSIVAVGPLTNVAEALLADPALASALEGIYIMGGAVEIGGNVGMSGVGIDNTVAEWNIYADPYAARVVFQSGAPLTLVPLNATRHATVTTDFFRCIQENHPTPEAKFVYELLRANADFVESGGFQFWDSLTAALFTDESLGTFEEMKLTVVAEEGPASGATRPARDGAPVRVAVSAHGERFQGVFLSVLNGEHR